MSGEGASKVAHVAKKSLPSLVKEKVVQASFLKFLLGCETRYFRSVVFLLVLFLRNGRTDSNKVNKIIQREGEKVILYSPVSAPRFGPLSASYA